MVRTAQYCRAKLAPPSIPHSFMRRSCNVMSCMYSVRARRGVVWLYQCRAARCLVRHATHRPIGERAHCLLSSPLSTPLKSNLILRV